MALAFLLWIKEIKNQSKWRNGPVCFNMKFQGFLGAEGKAVQTPTGWELEGNRWLLKGNQNLPKDMLWGWGHNLSLRTHFES